MENTNEEQWTAWDQVSALKLSFFGMYLEKQNTKVFWDQVISFKLPCIEVISVKNIFKTIRIA